MRRPDGPGECDLPMPEDQTGWLELEFAVPTGAGVDARDLAELLRDFSTAARVVADEHLSEPGRKGPRSAAERTLAAMRVVSVRPGSLIIEFAPPETGAAQASLFLPHLSASDIALEVLEGVASVTRSAQPDGASRRSRAFERLRRSAIRIAPSANAVLRHPGAGTRSFAISFHATEPAPATQPEITQRTMFGHVFMADVEFGRQRLRVKLPDGSDHTMPVDPELTHELDNVLDRVVELDVSEARVNGELVERVVGAIRLLEPAETGVDRPPKSIDDLAREQGLAMQPVPDYFALVDEFLEDEDEVDRFGAYLRNARSG